jgi:predicted glycosyltransferase
MCASHIFPRALRSPVEFCGYIRREPSCATRARVRQEWEIRERETVALVTTGGGEDGYHLIRTYLLGLESVAPANGHFPSWLPGRN